MKKCVLIAFFVAMAAVFVLSGCSTTKNQMDQGSTAKEAGKLKIVMDDDPNGLLTVNNGTTEDLLLFVGSINNKNNIGGIRQLSTRRVDFFDKVTEDTGSFLLRAVKYSTYTAKGSNLDAADDVIFAKIVTYDKKNPRTMSVDIQKSLGGDALIVLQNDSNMALEIRLDSLSSPTLTTLAPLERNKKVYLDFKPEGYVFFPIYKYYDRTSGEIRTLDTLNLADGVPMRPVPQGAGSAQVVSFDGKPAELYAPFAALVLVNETGRGAYLLQGGGNGTRMESIHGNTMINPGMETFELDLSKQESLTIGGLSIDLSLGRENVIAVPEYTYVAGGNYQVRVRGAGQKPVITEVGKSDTVQLTIRLVNER